jgi:GR25 family glycosyltransferase involved in LPS biosynthesis
LVSIPGEEIRVVVKKFVINLDRRPDRLREFFDRYGDSDVERFSGFDGRAFKGSHEILDALNRRHPNTTTGPGMLGAWVSHLTLWRNLSENDSADAFVIFEDDAFFCEGFMEKLNNVFDGLEPDMDIVYFGGRFAPGFWPRDMGNWGRYKNFWRPERLLLGRDLDRTAHGYVITKNGAKKAIKFYEEEVLLPPGITAVDGWLNEHRIKLFSLDVFPHICHSPLNYKTDIQM